MRLWKRKLSAIHTTTNTDCPQLLAGNVVLKVISHPYHNPRATWKWDSWRENYQPFIPRLTQTTNSPHLLTGNVVLKEISHPYHNPRATWKWDSGRQNYQPFIPQPKSFWKMGDTVELKIPSILIEFLYLNSVANRVVSDIGNTHNTESWAVVQMAYYSGYNFCVYWPSWAQGLWYRWWIILVTTVLYITYPGPKGCGTDGGLFYWPLSGK